MKLLFNCLLIVIATTVTPNRSDAAEITPQELEFFENRIRPVLAESCYDCHNSLKQKKGGLALDHRSAVLAGGDSGQVIVPGHPEKSLLIQAIRHMKGVEKMPRKSPKLVDEVIADFEEWVRLGAPDSRKTQPTLESLADVKRSWESVRDERKKWWSFQDIKKHRSPAVEDEAWQNTPIDAFIYDSLKEQGLDPSAQADRHTLIRRVSLILTGLPPTMEDVERFVKDSGPDAYERVVDRLLNSTHYGERWARYWMDWYRFSESHGSEGDPRIVYAPIYRNYLIRALNQDIPYNQLLKEHLAGDLIEEPRINHAKGINESAIGTAHLRMNPYGYGVVDAYAEQITFTDNQIDVISKAGMALTVSCARCHDHKFDPISQKDYYRFFGVMISNRPSNIIVDTQEKQDRNKNEIKAVKLKIKQALSEHWLRQLDGFEARLNRPSFKKPPENTHALSAWYQMKKHGDTKFEAFWKNQKKQTRAKLERNQKAVASAASYFDLRKPDTFADFFKTGNGSHGRISPAGSYALHKGGTNVIRGIYPQGIYSHLISDKHAALIGSPRFTVKGNNLFVRSAGEGAQRRYAVRHYPFGGLLHDNHTLSNRQSRWHNSRKLNIWMDDKIHYELKTAKDIISRPGDERSWWGVSEILVGEEAPVNIGVPLNLLAAEATNITNKEQLLDVYRQTLATIIRKWPTDKLSDIEAEFLDTIVFHNVIENQLDQLPAPLKSLIADFRKLEEAIPVPTRAPGVYEADVIDQELLVRGDLNQETDPVARRFLEIFGKRHYSKENSGRLELADDLISDKNPLTSRVLVNRLWNYSFGQGIVASTDNFGRMGRKPSHPELLDYLALYLQDNTWSIKKTIRLMVTSRAFKAQSQSTASTKEKDPANRYHSFYTPRRLDAEAIHDSLYFVAGKNRRAVYDKVIRNNLNPFLSTFNRPVPVTSVSRRPNNNVPAQALTMMNGLTEELSPAVLSRLPEQASRRENLEALFMHCYSRKITESDIILCDAFLGDEPDRESWRRLIAALLNSKEFIYVL